MMRAEPNFTVLYPCDAVSTERLVAAAACHAGPVYMRTSRPKTPVIYEARRDVPDRRQQGAARGATATSPTVVAAGVTVFEALKAYDELKRQGMSIRVIDAYSVQPIDGATLRAAAPRRADGSSRSRITTSPAASATRWRRRWLRRGRRCGGSR